MSNKIVPLVAALGASISLSSATAVANPFAMSDVAASHHSGAEGACGEGKCGAESAKKHEEGKCGEGKCGADTKKAHEEGKCGAEKSAEKTETDSVDKVAKPVAPKHHHEGACGGKKHAEGQCGAL